MGVAAQSGEGDSMTSELTRAPSAVARLTAVAVAVAVVSVAAIAPAVAQSDQPKRKPKLRSAEAAATVQDVSGPSVTRTWKIDKKEPNTLVATITAMNTPSAPIATSIVEPIPTTSLKRITF
jgi:hypothetical protein